jgi:hypothetical protein
LEEIDSWNEKINRMKEIKEEIVKEQMELTEIMNKLLTNDNIDENKKKKCKYDKTDFDELVTKFNESTNINEKVKLYSLIDNYISKVEKELFA